MIKLPETTINYALLSDCRAELHRIVSDQQGDSFTMLLRPYDASKPVLQVFQTPDKDRADLRWSQLSTFGSYGGIQAHVNLLQRATFTHAGPIKARTWYYDVISLKYRIEANDKPWGKHLKAYRIISAHATAHKPRKQTMLTYDTLPKAKEALAYLLSSQDLSQEVKA